MKSIIFAIILSTFSIYLYSQNNFQLFRSIDNYSIYSRDISPVKDAVYADLDPVQLRGLSEESPDNWKMTLPLSV